MEKNPVEVVKKKLIYDSIMYKIRWSNGSVTIDPIYHMNQQCLKLVNDYEVRNWNNPNVEDNEPSVKKNVKLNQVTQQVAQTQIAQVQQPQTTKTTTTQQNGDHNKKPEAQKPINQDKSQNQSQKNTIYIQQDSDQQTTPRAHKKRQNKPVKIKSLRNNLGKVEFMTEDDGWVDVDDLKAKSPISLCEFLLSKVKIQTPVATKK